MLTYVVETEGIAAAFEYAKRIGAPRILDIGAGSMRALTEVARSPLASGLHFDATILTGVKDQQQDTGLVTTHRTSAEVLRGIPEGSIGVALAVYSIAYSDSVPLVAKSVDRVLAPGGVVKAVFEPRSGGRVVGTLRCKDADTFARSVKTMGYDVAETGVPIVKSRNIVLAIKPGGPLRMNAEKLSSLDSLTTRRQLVLLDPRKSSKEREEAERSLRETVGGILAQ